MQKIITVTINLEKLQTMSRSENNASAYFVNEIEEVNHLLQEGWAIEEWENINTDTSNGATTLLFILTDELVELTDEYVYDEEHDGH
ncbi:hypothetical protein LX64_04042 [Chitinophaga skermanii]|uniref:Uncharacterized protein n=1 Tax=Chitinophaga skermanii TaxID=331697 RepID=A0A327Q7H8_9BACT|nr:hypothetical protein [Chitinophaga skermanii]RAJ00340.1 hypothetical protein LX64_04042 [Chitinophaga skermanii]